MIDYISATAGGIELHPADRDSVSTFWASNPVDLATLIKENGLADSVYHSSTMDFADEEGFDTHNGAWKLWEATMKIVRGE